MSISYKISCIIQIWTLILFPKLEPNKIIVLFNWHTTEMGIHSRARPNIASLLVSYGNGYDKKGNIINDDFFDSWHMSVSNQLSLVLFCNSMISLWKHFRLDNAFETYYENSHSLKNVFSSLWPFLVKIPIFNMAHLLPKAWCTKISNYNTENFEFQVFH